MKVVYFNATTVCCKEVKDFKKRSCFDKATKSGKKKSSVILSCWAIKSKLLAYSFSSTNMFILPYIYKRASYSFTNKHWHITVPFFYIPGASWTSWLSNNVSILGQDKEIIYIFFVIMFLFMNKGIPMVMWKNMNFFSKIRTNVEISFNCVNLCLYHNIS